MKKIGSRKIISLSIVIVGLVISLSIIESSAQKARGGSVNIKTGQNGPDPSLLFKSQKNKPNIENMEGLREQVSKEGNLTKDLARVYVSKLSEKNPGDLSDKIESEGSVVIPGGNTLKNDLDGYINQKLIDSFKSNKITVKDVNVGNKNSRSVQIRYLNEVEDKVQEHLSGVKKTEVELLNSWLTEKNIKPITKYKKALTGYQKSLEGAEAPPSLVNLHVDLINLIMVKVETYNLLENYSNDPIGGLVGFRMGAQLMQESQDIYQAFQKKKRDLNINE